jgi:hypothetical protein
MFALKSFGALGSMGNMGNMGSLGGLNNNIGSTYLLHDLKKTKTLNGSMAETYKSFITYMKLNELKLTYENLLDTLDSYIKKYNKLNLSISTLSKFPKVKKEVDKLRSEYLKESFITLFKQSFLSIGLTIYYLYKSPFIESFQSKVKISVLILLGLTGFFGYVYYTTSKKNHLEESNKRVKALYDDLKSETNFDISQIIVSSNTSDVYNPLLSELISEVYKKEDNKEIKYSVTQDITYTIINNSDSRPNTPLIIDSSSNDINDIIMSDISNNEIINDSDTESIIDIILSPQSEKEEICQTVNCKVEEVEEVDEVKEVKKIENIVNEETIKLELKTDLPAKKKPAKKTPVKKTPVKKTPNKKTPAKKSSK